MTTGAENMVAEARRIASEAHRGQKDKLGDAYIFHPARVAHRVRGAGSAHEAVAWLHDVVEDTAWTAAELSSAGFPKQVVDGVVAMTKQPDDGPLEAIRRACANEIARVVKAADVADNSDPERRARLDPETAERLGRKYEDYRRVLKDHGAPGFPDHVELSDSELELLS